MTLLLTALVWSSEQVQERMRAFLQDRIAQRERWEVS